MKITTATLIQQSAFGPEYLITLSSGTSFKMWAEWLLELDNKWDGNPNNLIGLEVTREFIDQYQN